MKRCLAVGVAWSVLAGCGGAEPDPAPFLPILDALDADGDGRVTEAEYAARAYAAPDFGTVDADEDGAIDPQELLYLVGSQDPLRFDDHFHPFDLQALQQEHRGRSLPRNLQQVEQALLFLAAEVRARDPSAEVPDGERIRRAILDASTDPARLEAVVAEIRGACRPRGIHFPPRLESLDSLGEKGHGDRAGTNGGAPQAHERPAPESSETGRTHRKSEKAGKTEGD